MTQMMLNGMGNQALPPQGTPVFDNSGSQMGNVRYACEPDIGQAGDSKPAEFQYLPFELQDQLSRGGFIQIDCGILTPDRVALLEQIDSADTERIVLKVAGDSLFKI